MKTAFTASILWFGLHPARRWSVKLGPFLVSTLMVCPFLGLHAATLSWSGGSASSANWSDSANWGYAGVPADGDSLVFPGGSARLTNTNNLSGRTFSQIRFAGPSGGYAIYGYAFTLTNSIHATNTAGINSIYNDMTLGGREIPVTVGSGPSLYLAGALSGAAGLTKEGAGTLRFAGPGGNTYGGTTRINAGLLLLYKVNFPPATAIPGDLMVGDGVNSATVRHLAGTEITDAAQVTVRQNGLLDLNNYSDVIAGLTLIGGTVQSGSGTLTLEGDLTTRASTATATVTGNLRLAGVQSQISVENGAAFYDLDLRASISDAGGGIIITNSGADTGPFVRLLGSNSFTGPLVIDKLTADAETPWALGATNGGTTVGSQGQLWIYSTSITNEALTMQGGARLTAQYECAWVGPITLNGDVIIANYEAPNIFQVIGTISGAGGFTKADHGVLRLAGTAMNTYAGDTWLVEGAIELAKANAIRYGTLTIGDGWGDSGADVVRELINEGIYGGYGGVTVVIRSSGLLDLNNHSDYLGPIEFDGGRIETGASGLLSVAPPITSYRTAATNGNGAIYGQMLLNFDTSIVTSNNLEVYASTSGSGGLYKDAFAYLFLLGSNSYSGLTLVRDGMLWAYNAWALGATNNGTVVSNGASLVLLGNFGITNESLTLNGPGENSGYGALTSQTTGTNLWTGPVTLNAPDCTIAPYFSDTVIRVIGPVSGAGGFTKFGAGKLYLEGATANSYSGPTWVQDGYLLLAKTTPLAISGSGLTIGDGTGAAVSALVQELANFQIGALPITLNNDGALDLNGFNDTVGNELVFNGGDIMTGAGTLTLQGGNTVRWNTAGSHIYGNLNVGGTTSSWSGSNVYTLACVASIHGAAAITKTDTAYLNLYGSNTFSGPLQIEEGVVWAYNSYALGQTNSGTTVLAPGRLLLSGGIAIADETIAISASDLISWTPPLYSSTGSNALTGPVLLTNNVLVGVNTDAWLNLAGPISGPGGLEKIGAGTLILSGGTANSYGGQTRADEGILLLGKSVGNGAIPGALIVGDGVGGPDADVVRLLGIYQIGGLGDIAIASSGLLDFSSLTSVNEAIGSFSGSGHIELGARRINTGGNNQTTTFSGTITGAGGQITKEGTGTFTLEGTNTYTGLTTANGGILVVNGRQADSLVSVGSLGTLAGRGTVGDITANGIVSPGTSPGALSCSNASFGATGRLVVELKTIYPGTGHDQLAVRGSVGFTNATLQVLPSFDPGYNVRVGDRFWIISNDGADPVTGTFLGLPNGSEFAAGDYRFRINYDGGTGNDVVLTVASAPASAASGFISGGNRNHLFDANECNDVLLAITNNTGVPMTGVSARLWSTNEELFVTQFWSDYPDIAPGGLAMNSTPYQVSTLPRFTCGPDVVFMLSVYTASHGAFSIPVVLPSGGGLSPSLACTNATPMALVDGGSITSTIPVAAFSGYLGKPVVSLYLTHSQDWDVVITLLAPDGTAVELTSQNGSTGMNYGLSCNPFENRTVFDDTAATSITNGVAPFAGLFRPQSPLSVLRGRTGAAVNGDWKLVVRDASGNGHTGSLLCWYLNLYPTACAEGGGMCETCPGTFQGAITATDPSMPGHFQLVSARSFCGQTKLCPPAVPGPCNYDSWSFTNDGPATCITVMLDTYSDSVQAAAYLGAFNPLDLCANYLGNAGAPAPAAQRFAFDVPGYTNFVVVVNDLGTGCSSYTLYVSGTPCPTPALAIGPTVIPNHVRVHWPTWAAGYQLQTNLTLSPGAWGPSTTEPGVSDGRFNVTNTAAQPTTRFYRLQKAQ